jgi:hypothetical protein
MAASLPFYSKKMKKRPAVKVGMDILQPNFDSSFGMLATGEAAAQLTTA